MTAENLNIPIDQRARLYPDYVEGGVGIRVGDDAWHTLTPDEARELAADIEKPFADDLDDPEFDHREFVNDLRRIADKVD